MEGGSSSNNEQHYTGGEPEVMQLAESTPKKRAGRKKFKETRHPVYRGIRQRSSDKWLCELREPNKKTRIWLGTFPTAEMAARAHDVAAIALRGRSACLNYADSAWRLPVPASTDPKDIQRAAAEAAELFRPAYRPPEEAASSSAAAPEEKEEEERMDWRDEEFFGMPEIVADMYNGMMLPPPPSNYDDISNAYVDDDADLPLWNF